MEKDKSRGFCVSCGIKTYNHKLSLLILPFVCRTVKVCNECIRKDTRASLHKASCIYAVENFKIYYSPSELKRSDKAIHSNQIDLLDLIAEIKKEKKG